MLRPENQDSRLNPQRHHGNNVGLEHPFTAAQWKELQRQAMVYKYLMASVPVPPHLLLPLATDSRFSSNCNYSLRFGRDGDPEPGRCKRTDGKKWRCSKEAMPDERYCDRHSKKRRSRKLVEQDSCKKARNGQKLDTCSNGSASNNSLAPVFLCSNGDDGLLQQKEPRALDWLMVGENRRPEVDNPNVYTGYDATKVNHHHHHHRFNEYPFSLDSDLVIPTRTHKPDTISRGGFFDAWSDKQSSPAPALDVEMGRIHMGLGVTNFFDAWSDKQSPPVSTLDEEMGRTHMGLGVTSWVGSGSWISSSSTPPGGPLAEVLQHKSTSPSSESPSHSGAGGVSSSLTVEPEITLQWFTK